MTTDEKLDLLLSEMSGVKTEISDMKTEMSDMKTEISDMKTEISDMKTEMSDMKRDILSVRLTLETETNRNIKVIAEGHLDLSRKLDEALTVENEKEMLLIRVNILENEVRKIKERLAV